MTSIQRRVLETLAAIEPPFVLSGGAALVGVYLGHRTTRDLDLFWRNREKLGELPRTVEETISSAGLAVETLRTTPAFTQLRVADESAAVVVDLIAETADNLDPPERHLVGSASILVDSPRAILAEKLCALLERSEPRDLVDVEALLDRGVGLETALADAPKRDSGFSPLTLAWVLRGLEIRPSADLDLATTERLNRFKLRLIERLVIPRP